jgi:transcriptional regulator with XRE-family HTH domain
MEQRVPKTNGEFRELLNAAYQQSGYSLRDLAAVTSLNFAYIWQIINGQRRPSRDVLIILCAYVFALDLEMTDQLLQSVGYKTLGTLRVSGQIPPNQ